MSILNNLKKAHAAVVLDSTKKELGDPDPEVGKLSDRINQAAIQALTEGMKSTAWKDYMALFASNETELKRLTEVSPTDRKYFPQLRAYIVSNSICDIGTTVHTSDKVGDTIDIDFKPADMQDDPVFIASRKIKIPDIPK